ncbi:Uncharacterized protein HZ326_11865 [Fusarium oxysporum f. sp. albedinis]|nr:Uncharacterized protein HZ326_11865 [Fusarium oxysporum f. sp. albedinis]
MAESISMKLEPIPNSEVPEETDKVGNVSIRESNLECCSCQISVPKYNILHLHAAVLSPQCMCKSPLIQTQKRPGLKQTPDRLVNPEHDPLLTRCQDFKHRPPFSPLFTYTQQGTK